MSKNKAGKKPLTIVKDNAKPNMSPGREPGKVRVTVNYIDSHFKNNEAHKEDVWEGEDVGINASILSTISIPLTVERYRDENGVIIGEKTVFIPHVFIKEFIFERIVDKA